MRLPPGRFPRCVPTLLVPALLCCAAGWVTAPLAADERPVALDAWERPFLVYLFDVDADSDGWTDDLDCDDDNPAIYPGAPQVCDGVNNDCDDTNWPHLIAWGTRLISFTVRDVQSVFAADVDGDGDVDVLSASYDDDKIAWYENVAGDGTTWSDHVISVAALLAKSVFAADVDGDGDADVLSASFGDSKIAWYENLAGDGSAWSEHVIPASATQAYSVFAVDVDGDGDIDVLSASASDDKIAWYENESGDGSSWVEEVISDSADYAKSVFAADVDGDGDVDVLSASAYDDKIAWYENQSAGAHSWTERVISDSANHASAVFAIDVDGDGDIDALSASALDDKIAWYENTQGDGTGWVTHVISVSVNACNTVFATDLDADGDPDVLTVADGGGVLWFENTAGDGSAWTRRIVAESVASGCAVFAEDVDGDGDRDVLSARSDDEVVWHEFGGLEVDDDGDGLRECDGDCDDAEAGCTNDCDDADSDGVAMCAGDCDDLDPLIHPHQDESGETLCWDEKDNDCDGLTDWADPGCICTGTNEDGDRFCLPEDCDDTDPTVYPGAPQVCGDGVNNDCDSSQWPALEVWTRAAVPTDISAVYAVALEDVDGDSDPDILATTSRETGRAFEWYENLAGDGSAWADHLIASPVGGSSFVSADVDGDGDLDLLSAEELPSGLKWYENLVGDGSAWTGHTISTTLETLYSVSAADVDGDGDLDALSGCGTDESLLWYENAVGNGSVWTEHVISSPGRVSSVAAADVDGDGDMDIFSTHSHETAVMWYENLVGDGSAWTGHLVYTSDTWNGGRVLAVDMDGDGDQDALSTVSYTVSSPFFVKNYIQVQWNENVGGDGSLWTAHQVHWIMGWGLSACPGDIDSDGDLDVLISDSTMEGDSGRILWSENSEGSGLVWTPRLIDSVVVGSVLAGDLDGNESLDVLYASYLDPVLAWYKQVSLEKDDDSDGVCEPDDCDDEDDLTWAVPGEVLDLVFHVDRETLSWTEPEVLGRVGGPLYDTLRTTAPGDFVDSATCVEWGDDSDTVAVDSDLPPAGAVYHYLVCATSACGTGPTGTNSYGIERDLRVCP